MFKLNTLIVTNLIVVYIDILLVSGFRAIDFLFLKRIRIYRESDDELSLGSFLLGYLKNYKIIKIGRKYDKSRISRSNRLCRTAIIMDFRKT